MLWNFFSLLLMMRPNEPECLYLAIAFKSSLGNTRSLPKIRMWNVLQLRLLWPCPQILRPDWKGFPRENPLANRASPSVTKEKKFYNIDTRSLLAECCQAVQQDGDDCVVEVLSRRQSPDFGSRTFRIGGFGLVRRSLLWRALPWFRGHPDLFRLRHPCKKKTKSWNQVICGLQYKCHKWCL